MKTLCTKKKKNSSSSPWKHIQDIGILNNNRNHLFLAKQR